MVVEERRKVVRAWGKVIKLDRRTNEAGRIGGVEGSLQTVAHGELYYHLLSILFYVCCSIHHLDAGV